MPDKTIFRGKFSAVDTIMLDLQINYLIDNESESVPLMSMSLIGPANHVICVKCTPQVVWTFVRNASKELLNLIVLSAYMQYFNYVNQVMLSWRYV